MWMWMKPIFFIIIIIITANASNVNEITTQNFDAMVKNSNKLWIMEFYSPTCPYCKEFAPEYEQVGNALEGTNIKVGRIDGVHNDHLAQVYQIRGYPTVKLFKPENPTPEDYNGPRKASVIIDTAKALLHDKKIRSFGEVYLNLPQVNLICAICLVYLI